MRKGRVPGIYTNYEDVIVQIQRYRGAEYRRFDNYSDAMHYHNPSINVQKHPSQSEILMQFDGGSRGNPGKAGSGVIIKDKHNRCWEGYKYLGDNITNNFAEYEGLIIGLKYLRYHNLLEHAVEVQGDSKLVINQMLGNWECRDKILQEKRAEALELIGSATSIAFTWIPREDNSHADKLSNDAMDTEATCILYNVAMQQPRAQN